MFLQCHNLCVISVMPKLDFFNIFHGMKKYSLSTSSDVITCRGLTCGLFSVLQG